jgi:hypothetical protein
MDAPTLEALRQSIAQWEEYATDTPMTNVVIGTSSCPLCARFFGKAFDGTRCRGCPVYTFTGKTSCEGTPFRAAVDAKYNTVSAFRLAARAEADFLKSLLPESEQ